MTQTSKLVDPDDKYQGTHPLYRPPRSAEQMMNDTIWELYRSMPAVIEEKRMKKRRGNR